VIAALARDILRRPVTVTIGQRSAPAVGITQAAYPVPEPLKSALVRYLLRHMAMPSVLVFTRTKQAAKRLTKLIAADGFAVTELHGNRTQAQRARAMDGFRRGDFQVLVATNIAARGLDVDHITHVISVDVPDVPDDYVHRIGRTGRGGGRGGRRHPGLPGGGAGAGRHRAADRAAVAAGDVAGLRLRPSAADPARAAGGQGTARPSAAASDTSRPGGSRPAARSQPPPAAIADGPAGRLHRRAPDFRYARILCRISSGPPDAGLEPNRGRSAWNTSVCKGRGPRLSAPRNNRVPWMCQRRLRSRHREVGPSG